MQVLQGNDTFDYVNNNLVTPISPFGTKVLEKVISKPSLLSSHYCHISNQCFETHTKLLLNFQVLEYLRLLCGLVETNTNLPITKSPSGTKYKSPYLRIYAVTMHTQ